MDCESNLGVMSLVLNARMEEHVWFDTGPTLSMEQS